MIRIFVGNLPFNVAETDLRTTFERYGRVSSVQIITDPTTQRSRGFAFVRMPSLDDADEAINRLSGTSMNGRPLTVTESQDDRRKPQQNSGEHSARSRALDMFNTLCSE